MAGQDEFVKKVTTLQKEIKQLKKQGEPESEYQTEKAKLDSYDLIASYMSLRLYPDRIEDSEKGDSIPLDSSVQAAVKTSGTRWATHDTHGGGSRPTLTRIGAGALIAGPVGAVIGSQFQKHKQIKTDVEVHDDRWLSIEISSKKGYMDVVGSSDNVGGARSFVSKVMNTVKNHSKIKKEMEAGHKELAKKVAELEKTDPLLSKEKELEKLMKSASEAELKALGGLNTLGTIALVIGIGALLVSPYPIIGIVAPAIALIVALVALSKGEKSNKATAGLILAILGIIANFGAMVGPTNL